MTNRIVPSVVSSSDSGGATGQSLLFDGNSTMTHNPSAEGNRGKWTVSVWVKRCSLDYNSAYQTFFYQGGGNGTPPSSIRFTYEGPGKIEVELFDVNDYTRTCSWISDAIFNDPSSWYHFVVSFDNSLSGADEILKVFHNGNRIYGNFRTSPTTGAVSSVNSTWPQTIGDYVYNASGKLNAYLSEYHLIDGQALGPEHFALTDSKGVYNPIRYTGTYGNNGFYLPFSDTDSSESTTFTVNSTISSADILIVAGGGGGGGTLGGRNSAGGGGGAGGLLEGTSISLNTGSYTVMVGAGGAGGGGEVVDGATNAGSGSNSSISNSTWGTATAIGGGRGGKPDVDVAYTGGSGGGGSGYFDSYDGAPDGKSGTQGNDNGLTGYGNAGGDGGQYNAGAGGGARNVGGGNGGSGGAGRDNAFRTGSNVTYAVGGNGRTRSIGNGTAGAANTGTGGEGGYANTAGDKVGGAGGSGIVVIRYISGTPLITGGTVTSYTSGSDTYQVHTWVSSDSGLGTDYSGNGNDFTPSGLTSDSVVADSPTNNYCTMSPIDTLQNENIILSEGNLSVSIYTNDEVRGTIAIPTSGKWYWEYLKQDTVVVMVGVTDQSNSVIAYRVNTSVVYNSLAGTIYNFNSSPASYGSGWNTSGTIVGIAINMDDNEITFYNNGSSQGTLTMGGTASLYNMIPTNVTGSGQADGTFNFGQRSWAYEPPSGYKALCTKNLPDTLVNPKEHFSAVTYTGNGSVISVTGVGFKPDAVWQKDRSHDRVSLITDSVRGENKTLYPTDTDAESDRTAHAPNDALRSFDPDGFTCGSNAACNYLDHTFVAWNFRGGSNIVTNNDGSIPSEVSANKDMGFSVVKWNMSMQTLRTIGHGLGKIPDLIITKKLTGIQRWEVYSTPTGVDNGLVLNEAAASAAMNTWGSFQPTDKVFMFTQTTGDYIAYCFTNTEMLQVGSYVGNGVVDGPMVSLPFKPAFVLIKGIERAGSSWFMFDNKRDPYNVVTHELFAESSAAEGSGSRELDFLSNGFKIRTSSGVNYASEGMLYLAIAKQNFKQSRGR